MSKIDDLISKIKAEKIGQTQKKALIVEGPDDVLAFQTFLAKKNNQWETNWVIAPAGGKKNVLDVIGNEPTWVGIIDCDEWSATSVQTAAAAHPNLYILPRFCIESYMINPKEIWNALPPKQQAKIAQGESQLTAEIEKNLNNWIRHAAIWHVVHPLYMFMRESGHRDSLLDPASVPTQTQLQTILNTWLQKLNGNVVAQQVYSTEQQYTQIQKQELYSKYIYMPRSFIL
jgi:hypothetical protein